VEVRKIKNDNFCSSGNQERNKKQIIGRLVDNPEIAILANKTQEQMGGQDNSEQCSIRCS
jgi:hypothetical protein